MCWKEATQRLSPPWVTMFLEQKKPEVPITEAVLLAAVTRWRANKETFRAVLTWRKEKVPITEAVLVAMFNISWEETLEHPLKYILIERGDDICVSWEVVWAAVGDRTRNYKATKLLLEWKGNNGLITHFVRHAIAYKQFDPVLSKVFESYELGLNERRDGDNNVTDQTVAGVV